MLFPSLLEQQGIDQDNGGHSLDNRHGSRHDARVMPPLDRRADLLMKGVDSRLLHQYSGSRLKSHTEIYILTIGYAALDSAAVVGARPDAVSIHIKRVIVQRASRRGAGETGTILKALDGADREHGVGQHT